MLFLVVYLVTLLGNLGLMVLIRLDPRLHTPMYFFLTNLAFVDLCYSSNATPPMLTHLFSEKKTISFAGCFAQCYIFIALLLTEFYMLAAMAYDRYVAICNPLRYSVKMSRRVCLCLATFPYAYGFSDGLFQAILTFRLTFCSSNIINHFYCADPPLINFLALILMSKSMPCSYQLVSTFPTPSPSSQCLMPSLLPPSSGSNRQREGARRSPPVVPT